MLGASSGICGRFAWFWPFWGDSGEDLRVYLCQPRERKGVNEMLLTVCCSRKLVLRRYNRVYRESAKLTRATRRCALQDRCG